MYYSPVRHWSASTPVRLACIRHAASVHPEPGSNSSYNLFVRTLSSVNSFCSISLRIVLFVLTLRLFRHIQFSKTQIYIAQSLDEPSSIITLAYF